MTPSPPRGKSRPSAWAVGLLLATSGFALISVMLATAAFGAL